MLNYAAIVRGDYFNTPSPAACLRISRKQLQLQLGFNKLPEAPPSTPSLPDPKPLLQALLDPEVCPKIVKPVVKKRILSMQDYGEISNYIERYDGLAAACQEEMIKNQFTHINPETLTAIIELFFIERARTHFMMYASRVDRYLRTYDVWSKTRKDSSILVDLAIREHMCPVILCRLILRMKLHIVSKNKMAYLLNNLRCISDPLLRANVRECLKVDITDGPAVAAYRRQLGMKYEDLLKAKCKEANVRFIDEKEMRARFYRKTPDVKIKSKLFYKGERVYWIESKATFCDTKSHQINIGKQLAKYNELFGPGIVIYWFGYTADVPNMTTPSEGITVLADFPMLKHLHVERYMTGNGGGNRKGVYSVHQ